MRLNAYEQDQVNFKTKCHSNESFKTNQEVKTIKFILLNHETSHFSSNSHPKKKNLHLHRRFYAIKDDHIRQLIQYHVVDSAKIYL